MQIQLFKTAVVATFLVLFSPLYGGNEGIRGTAGAQELLIPVGARTTALGGASIANATGTDAIFWNPSGIAVSRNRSELFVSQMQYIADINISYAALVQDFGDIGCFGLAVKVMDIGEMVTTTIEQPDGTGETYTPNLQVWSLSFARSFTDRVAFGATVKLIVEDIADVSAYGVGFDFGVQYESGFPGLRLGLAVKNLGPTMQFKGNGLYRGEAQGGFVEPVSIVASEFELPVSIEGGATYKFTFTDFDSWNLGFSFLDNSYDIDELKFGLEYNFDETVFLRGGYRLPTLPEEDQTGKNLFEYSYSLGLGLQLALFDNLVINTDYCFRGMQSFDGNHVVSVKFCWR
jgi:opacity protein-like surface antigen